MRAPSLRILAGALALALVGGCDPGPTPPVALPAGPSLSHAVGDYVLIQGRIPSGLPNVEVSRLIGADGGSLHLAGHSISVPAGAVSEPALFTLALGTNGHVEVELNAIGTGLLGGADVGAGGFGDETVALTLTYAWAGNVSDPDDLVILRMNEDDSVTPVPVTVDRKNKTVTAQLEHFSRYCMASN